jgi:hypothetical protein
VDTNRYVEVPAGKLREAVAAAYDLSRPQGLGMLHFQPGQLTDEQIEEIIELGHRRGGLHMDYVKGRACKFSVHEQEGRFYVSPRWFDHSHDDLVELLTRIGVQDPEHQIAVALEAQKRDMRAA